MNDFKTAKLFLHHLAILINCIARQIHKVVPIGVITFTVLFVIANIIIKIQKSKQFPRTKNLRRKKYCVYLQKQSTTMSLTIQNLTKTYGTNIAVNNISFRIDSGEVVGFLGPNGAGKSTTMKIITGCISADSGTVLINGNDITTGGTQLKHSIGYLPENNPLYLNMYVREYLEYSAAMYIPRSETKKAVDYSIDAVGLGEHQFKKIGELSKGYRQRTGIARAMVHNPEILILDEPTTGLDPNQIVEIRNLIKQLGREKTVILSTHIMQEAEAVCNRAIIIRKGVIVADDSLAALKERNSRQTVTVEFDGAIAAEQLSQIQGVTGVEGDGRRWTLTVDGTDGGDETRRAIFRLAVALDVPILEMKRGDSSLENIFHELTFGN